MPDARVPAGPAAARPSPVVGHFGLTSDWRLEGWCCRLARPEERPLIDITLNGQVVASCSATRLNDTLRQSGIGDGRYGFSLSPPAQIGEDATNETIIEAHERSTGAILGRVIFNPERRAVAQAALVDRLEARVQACFAGARAQDRKLELLGRAFQQFGDTLLAENHRRALGGPDGLSAGQVHIRAAVERCPPVRMRHAACPDLTLIFLTTGAWRDTLDAIRHAVAAMPLLSIEFILVDDGTDPGHGLLQGRVDQLRRFPGRGASVAAAVNDAALAARGSMVCCVDQAPAFDAAGLLAAIHGNGRPIISGRAAQAVLGAVGADCLDARLVSSVLHGIALLIRRDDLLACGGFDADPATGAVCWQDLAAKLAALGGGIELWHAPVQSAGIVSLAAFGLAAAR